MLTFLLLSSAILAITVLGQDFSKRDDTCELSQYVNKVDLLNLHNQARKMMNVDLLKWDDGLACFSQNWANQCKWEHSHREGFGENIACGYGSNYNPERGVQDWYEEIFGYNVNIGYSEKYGHATQMGWKDTTHVGCGVGMCQASALGLSSGDETSLYLVCGYYPPGNVIDHFIGQVFTPSSNQMVDLKHNATHNDANPALFVAINGKESQPASSSSQNKEAVQTQENQPISYEQNTANPEAIKKHHNHNGASSGKHGFHTKSWQQMQDWIKQKAKEGVNYSWSWSSSSNSKRSLSDDPSMPVDDEDVVISRKGTSVFVSNKEASSLSRRRLHKKRRSIWKL